MRGHLNRGADPLLTKAPLAERLGGQVGQFFDLDVAEEARRMLRRAAVTGRPLGAAAWVKAMDRSAGVGATLGTRTTFPQSAGG